jgi:hypothetical protein
LVSRFLGKVLVNGRSHLLRGEQAEKIKIKIKIREEQGGTKMSLPFFFIKFNFI